MITYKIIEIQNVVKFHVHISPVFSCWVTYGGGQAFAGPHNMEPYNNL